MISIGTTREGPINFISQTFTVPKKEGSCCPVVNLKLLIVYPEATVQDERHIQEHHAGKRLDGVCGPERRLSLYRHRKAPQKVHFLSKIHTEFRCLLFALSSAPCT